MPENPAPKRSFLSGKFLGLPVWAWGVGASAFAVALFVFFRSQSSSNANASNAQQQGATQMPAPAGPSYPFYMGENPQPPQSSQLATGLGTATGNPDFKPAPGSGWAGQPGMLPLYSSKVPGGIEWVPSPTVVTVTGGPDSSGGVPVNWLGEPFDITPSQWLITPPANGQPVNSANIYTPGYSPPAQLINGGWQ